MVLGACLEPPPAEQRDHASRRVCVWSRWYRHAQRAYRAGPSTPSAFANVPMDRLDAHSTIGGDTPSTLYPLRDIHRRLAFAADDSARRLDFRKILQVGTPVSQ